MKNFLIFFSAFVVIFLAAIDIKDRLNELEQISDTQKTKIELRKNINHDIESIKVINKH